MEKITRQKILENIGKVYEESKKSKLEPAFFESVNNELELLSSYFKTTKNQAFFISMVFALNYKSDSVDLNDLIYYFDCNPMKILEFSDDFEHLCTKGIFEKHQSSRRIKLAGTNDQFRVHKKISEAILQNLPMPEIGQQKIANVIDFLEQIYKIGQQRDEGLIVTYQLFAKTKELISENTHFPLVKKINHFDFDLEDTHLYLYLIWKTLSGSESVDVARTLEGVYDKSSKRIKYLQQFLSGENILIKNNLIELVPAQFFNDTEMKLTEHSHQILNECGIKLFLKKKKNEAIIAPDDIVSRKLIFDPTEMNQLFLLKNLLRDAKFKETQDRLTDKGLPKGIAVLLHGAPGTGKTEIVKQLAKETEREIMKVEISKSKSMWFGESEKIIKCIFTDYKTHAKDCERTPILFFNEADAIFSTRREVGNSNVGQTENAIQNIILEEMENFEGILIATTNLTNNLDSAFERRFLFKVRFEKPSESVRAKIWESKLPQLKEEEYKLLAGNFDFTGGQIDNILRKKEIQEIVHGNTVNFENILSFCEEESVVTKRTKIGFCHANN